MSSGAGHIADMIARMRFNKHQLGSRKHWRDMRKDYLKTSRDGLPKHPVSKEELRKIQKEIREDFKKRNARERRLKICLLIGLVSILVLLLLAIKFGKFF